MSVSPRQDPGVNGTVTGSVAEDIVLRRLTGLKASRSPLEERSPLLAVGVPCWAGRLSLVTGLAFTDLELTSRFP